MSQRPAAPGTLGAPGLGAILQHGLPGGSTAPETGLHRHARCTLGATGSSFCLGPPRARLPRSPASEHPLRARLPSTRATGALGGPGDARRPPVCGPRRDLAAHSGRRRRSGGGRGVAVALILLALPAPSGAVVRAVRAGNASTLDFADLPALFGVPLAPEGVRGYLTEAEPADACRPIAGPRPGNGSLGAIALIRPNDCTFDLKALHAQRAGFEAAVVRDARSDELVRTAPGFEEPRRQIAIRSVFVGEAASRDLRLIVRRDRSAHVLRLPDYPPCPKPDRHPLPAASWVLGRALALLTSAAFVLRRLWWAWLGAAPGPRGPAAQTQARRKARVRTFTRRNDLCAICLDDYEEGDRLKVLPCSHTYHCKCIDPWFAQAARRSCPVCQQSLAGTEDGSDSTVESLGDEDPSLPGHRPPLWAVQARLRSRRLRLLARAGSHGLAEATASPERPPEPP
ncbi:E3 ubiquitin-protein ligase ZNRF4 [Prionailurus bengalensis]|uniref:E3 ubiquitin-protein ligase ZNRF4 n=1 Tax=Prionailurus bengalensis TaxID=37029 RepID=UPI001CA8A9E8|nr:E3 ubiquitin-protein ligase ZNRF4 [Prionailurus bengalensis]